MNRIFERNGMAFELKDGEVTRTAPAVLHESLAEAAFHTGDGLLDATLQFHGHLGLPCSPPSPSRRLTA